LNLIAEISRGKKVKKFPFWVVMFYAWLLEVAAFFTKKAPYITRSTLKAIKYHRSYSSKKAIDQLGYKITPLREALEETIKWYKDFNAKEQ
jgi:nucleoside-diphosphate-sugar epimerase